MSKRTRYFMIGAVAFLVVGLSIGTVAYYNGGLKALTGSNGPAELQFVPENAVVVAFANVQQIMSSNFRQRMKALEAGKGEKGQQEFRDQTGIDIEKDIDTVVAYMTAPPAASAQKSDTGAETPRPGGVVIATGRFQQDRIAALVREKGGTVGDYKGKAFMTFAQGMHGENAPALAFVSPTQVAVGSPDAVRLAIDMAGRRQASVMDNEKMAGLIREVDNGNAWVVGRFDALSSQAHLPQQVVSQIPPISWFSATTNIDGGVTGTVTVEANNADAAANLARVIEGLKGLAALQVQSNPNVPSQAQQVLSSFAVRQDGARLSLSFSVPSDVLDALSNLTGKSGHVKK